MSWELAPTLLISGPYVNFILRIKALLMRRQQEDGLRSLVFTTRFLGFN